MTERSQAILAGFIEVTSIHDQDPATNKIGLKAADVGFVRRIRTPDGYTTVMGALATGREDVWEVVETPEEIYKMIQQTKYYSLLPAVGVKK